MRRFEVQFNRFLEVGKGLFLGLALAGEVELEALGDIPLPLAPNGSGKRSLHDLIVSQATVLRATARVGVHFDDWGIRYRRAATFRGVPLAAKGVRGMIAALLPTAG